VTEISSGQFRLLGYSGFGCARCPKSPLVESKAWSCVSLSQFGMTLVIVPPAALVHHSRNREFCLS
jgi:hypothetical protein